MSLVDNLVVTCDEIEDMVRDLGYPEPESAVINPSYNSKPHGINDWLIAIALLVIACLLLLVNMPVKYGMKCELTICYYASDYHISIKMNKVKEIDIKNPMRYFFNDLINIKNVDPNKIKTEKKPYKNVLFYYIRYVATNSVKILYLIINEVNGCIEESNGNTYMTLAPTDESIDTLKNYKEIWSKIRDLIRSISNRLHKSKPNNHESVYREQVLSENI